MATGTAVITNSKVLVSLSVTPGRELLVADTADEFARCALKLIENPLLRDNVARAGLQYVQNNHDWKEITRRMVAIYHPLISQATRRGI